MPKAGDIIFSTDEEPLSVLIRARTNSPVSHVAMFINEVAIYSARAKGVIVDTILDWPNCVVLRFNHITNTQIDIMVSFIREQQGKGYDYQGLLDFLTNRDLHDPSKWFCSELVTAAILAAGIPIFGWRRESAFTSPGDLYSNPLLVEVT
ncbi:MAG: hypothetical protein HQK95_08640 [Nitrospirae bacterium]|nr:hypothetical protein [Nitrospirota bacterium]